MGEVIKFTGVTTVEEPPERVLDAAKKWGMVKCLIVGLDGDGNLQFGGSFSDSGEIMLLLEGAKEQIVRLSFGASNGHV